MRCIGRGIAIVPVNAAATGVNSMSTSLHQAIGNRCWEAMKLYVGTVLSLTNLPYFLKKPSTSTNMLVGRVLAPIYLLRRDNILGGVLRRDEVRLHVCDQQ